MAESDWATLKRKNEPDMTVQRSSVVAFCADAKSSERTFVWINSFEKPLHIDETVEDVARALGAA